MSELEEQRIQKIIAQSGLCSRREAERYIEDGEVRVNGKVAQLGDKALPDAAIFVKNKPLMQKQERIVTLIMNKPKGVHCTNSDPHAERTVFDLLPADLLRLRLFCAGRLDKDSEGLLVITNDGDLAHRITHPSHGVEKEYLVHVKGHVSVGGLRRLRDGVELDDGITAPATASQPSPGVLRLTIHEGRNRQVRRMCEAIGHPVLRLVRTRIGPIADRSLRPGDWRELSTGERRGLAEAVART